MAASSGRSFQAHGSKVCNPKCCGCVLRGIYILKTEISVIPDLKHSILISHYLSSGVKNTVSTVLTQVVLDSIKLQQSENVKHEFKAFTYTVLEQCINQFVSLLLCLGM